MTRSHRDEAERSWPRDATEDAKSDDMERGEAAVLILLSTNAEMKG